MGISKTSTYKNLFFISIGTVGLLAVLIGFSKTFIIPVSKGSFTAPIIIYIHGAFAFSWISLFFIQATLIRYNNFQLHKKLGIIGVFIAIGAAATILPAGIFSVQKQLKQGLGETAFSSFLGTVTTAVMYLALVIAGIINRKKPQIHKRLMLLATIVLLWPAWFRFRHYFPSITRPDIWFAIVLADSLIIISFIWDKIANGKIHRTLLYIGLFIIAEHFFEAYMFDTTPWRSLSKPLYYFFRL